MVFLNDLWQQSNICFGLFGKLQLKQWMTGVELTEDKERGPGENVILVSRATRGLGLPDGALAGLAKGSFGSPAPKDLNCLDTSLLAQTARRHSKVILILSHKKKSNQTSKP